MTVCDTEFFTLREQIKDVETENLKMLSQAKSIIGWPLVGDSPPDKPESMSQEEFDAECEKILNRWLVFVKSLSLTYHAALESVRKKYAHYDGEKKVPASQTRIGKTPREFIEGRRILDL